MKKEISELEDFPYSTVASGIEAPSCAWDDIEGFRPVWFSQYDPEHDYKKKGLDFASMVLKHRFPDVPNLGDMTLLNQHNIYNESIFRLLIGGTPCQSFSIAGLRGGLDDERGNLSLTFARILIEKRPEWFIWENVPGVLSSGAEPDEDGTEFEPDAFACLLSAWTGKNIAPQKLGKGGIIEGELYSVAWRIFDSQYFGVAQTRRRLFVVGHIGKDWRPPTAVLFESDSLRGNFEKGKRKEKRTSGKTGNSTKAGSDKEIIIDRAAFNQGKNAKYDPKIEETNVSPTIVARGPHAIGYSPIVYRMKAFGDYIQDETASALKKRDYKDATDLVLTPPHVFKERGGKPGGGKGYLRQDEKAFTLATNSNQNVCYALQDKTIGRKLKNTPNGSGFRPELCYTLTTIDRHAVVYQDVPRVFAIDALSSNSMKSKNPHSGFNEVQIARTLDTNVPNPNCNQGGNCVVQQYIIRRFTPLECERLQGFPDGWVTDVPGATDNKCYQVLGNSMPVPVIKFLGLRIKAVSKMLQEKKM